jgi:hypothetical protein
VRAVTVRGLRRSFSDLCAQIFVKDVVSHIKLSNWGLVYYNNGIGTLMSILVFLLTDEAGMRAAPTAAAAADQAAEQASRRLLVLGNESSPSESSLALAGIAMSCVFGVGIRCAREGKSACAAAYPPLPPSVSLVSACGARSPPPASRCWGAPTS